MYMGKGVKPTGKSFFSMHFNARLVMSTLTMICVLSAPSMVATASQELSQQNRVIIVTKDKNIDLDEVLLKYKYQKVKKISQLQSAKVVNVDDDELAKLKSNNTIQVYDDVVIADSNPSSSSNKRAKQLIPWGIERLNAEAAWNYTTGKGVKVAVIDSGIAKNKDVFKNVAGEYNAIDPKEKANDNFGHGTHVAGIIAAINNKKGVVGVAPEASLYDVKVLDANGNGYLSDLIEGIEWSVHNGVQIINLSIGLSIDVPLLKESIENALNSGVFVVAAAGNNYGGKTLYPAAYDGVFSVSAIDDTDQLADFSAIGKIDFAAPGADIYSTYLNKGYTYKSGTSMAAPHVTGMLALLLGDTRNDLDGDGVVSTNEVKSILNDYVEDLGPDGIDDRYGRGILKF